MIGCNHSMELRDDRSLLLPPTRLITMPTELTTPLSLASRSPGNSARKPWWRRCRDHSQLLRTCEPLGLGTSIVARRRTEGTDAVDQD